MSDDNKLPTPAEATPPGTIKRGSLGLKRALQKEKFNPVRQLLRYVYPNLPPEHQAKICMELISYCYPKFKAQEVATRTKAKSLQNNIQINLPGPTSPKEPSVEDLLEIASRELSDS